MIDTYRGVVYPSNLDHMGHMNVQYYTARFDEATWHLFSALGLTRQYMDDSDTGMAALEQTTKYKSEVSAGALLVIRSCVLEVSNKTVRFIHYMFEVENEIEVATSELIGAHFSRKVRKSVPLPGFVAEKATALMRD